MARELITSWGDYQSAVDRVLAMAEESLLVYGGDLLELKLDSTPRLNLLRRLANQSPRTKIQIALRNGEPLKRENPRFLEFLRTFSDLVSVRQTASSVSHLKDTLIIVDGKYGLIRFHEDQARSKLLIDEVDELAPYLRRFEELWGEHGEEISGSTLGL